MTLTSNAPLDAAASRGDASPASLSRKLAYSLAAGAAAGTAATADAAVTYSGLQDLAIGQFSAQNLNLDGDAYNDVLLKNYVFAGGNYQGLYVNFFPGKAVGFNAGLNYATALNSGFLVDSASTSGGVFAASLAFGANNPNAQFNAADDAFIGLAFPIGGVTHYGWLRVDINNAAGTFVIRDWAYESSPGVGIVTGAGIPEPGTLGLLAAGAAGVAALRRRRAAA
jgi:hypothetical protein